MAATTDTDMGTHRKVGSAVAAVLLLLGGHPAQAQTSTPSGADAGSDSAQGSPDSAGHDLRFLPGVRFTQSYSTNPLRRPAGDEKDGFITEVSPYLEASVDRARLQGDLRLMIRNFYRTATTEGIDSTDMLRYVADGRFNYRAPSGGLGLLGSGTIRDVNLAPFDATGVDPSLVPINRTRFTVLSLTPYVEGRLGSIADYRAEYTARTTQTSGGGNLVDRLDQRIRGTLSSGPRYHRWGWAVNADRQHRDFGSGFALGRSQAAATLYYYVNPELRVGASANYAQIDRLVGTNGRDNGWGPGLELDWRPSSRTQLQANVADQYYGSTGNLRLSHRAHRWTFGFDYTRAVVSSSSASVLFFNPASLFSGDGFAGGYNPVYQALLDQQMLGGDNVLGAGLMSDAVIYSRQATASLGYSIPRGSILFTAYRSMRDRAVENIVADSSFGAFSGNLQQRGVTLGMRLNMDLRSSLRFMGRVAESESSTLGVDTRLTSLQASYHTQFTSDLAAGIGVRQTRQRSSGSSLEYDDSTIFGTLDVRF